MKHVLLTGGAGYKGIVLCEELLSLGYQVTVFDIMWFGNHLQYHENLRVVEGDIRDTEKIPMTGVDVIIHLANVANDPCGELSAKLSWEVNVLALRGMVEKAIEHQVSQFIFASSGSVYGVKEEEHVTEDLPLVPISDYNKTKMIAERVLLSYQRDILVQIIRPATVCGYSPRMRLDVSVNLLTYLALTKGRITVFGGQQTRPNIHMRDIVSVYVHFLKLGERGEGEGIYNAGFENVKIMDIAEKVIEYVPAKIEVTESNDPRSYRQNSDKLLSTGFTPKFSYIDGIKDVKAAFESGKISGDDSCYNIRTMSKLDL